MKGYPRMKTSGIKRTICIMSALSVLALAGCGKKEPPAEAPKETGTSVKVHTVANELIKNTVTYTGEIKASETNAIAAEVSAVVKSINFEEGDFVSAGQLLVQLDDTNYRNSYDTALANYNQTQANVKQSTESCQNSLNSAKVALSTAETNYNRELTLYNQNSSVTLAEQSYNDAQAAYDRQKNLYDNDTSLVAARNSVSEAETNYNSKLALFEIGAASQVEVDTALNSLNSARASLTSLESQNQAALDNAYSALVSAQINLDTAKTTERASLDNAENSLSSAKTSYNNAVSALESSKATGASSIEVARNSLKTAEQNLSKTKVYATSSGYATSKGVTAGQMINAGGQVCVIKNVNSVDAEISVTEAVIPYIQVGTEASVSVKSAGLADIKGTVTMVNTVKDDKTGMYTVRVNIPNERSQISVGMFADITLTTEESADTIAVPSESLIQEGEDYYVFAAVSDTQAEKRLVELGLADKDNTEIISGVELGDRVITEGKDYLSESNTEIRITGEGE